MNENQLTCIRMHHLKGDTVCLYLYRNKGGRGMIQLGSTYKNWIIGQVKYRETTKVNIKAGEGL